MNHKQIFSCSIVSIFAAFVYLRNQHAKKVIPPKVCYKDLIENVSVCNFVCPNGSFSLPGMLKCRPWLDCETKLSLVSTISTSVVKTVYLAKWKSHEVILSVLSSNEYEEDFQQNLSILKSLSGQNIIQLLGFCKNNIITRYHKLGSALNTNYHLTHSLKMYDSMKLRLNLCINYVSIIRFLHTSPIGVRVMCDSNSLEKTLSQYLLREDLMLIANDLDAVPEVQHEQKKGIICGHRALTGTFIAPEQVWPLEEEKYSPEKMVPYDEKTDIWKIPDVCNWFLGTSYEADVIKYKLFNLHKSCKSIEPSKRPTATLVLETYGKIANEIF